MDDIMIDSDDQKQMILIHNNIVKKEPVEAPTRNSNILAPVATSTTFYFPDRQFSLMKWKNVEQLSAWIKQQEQIKFGRRLFQIDPYKQLSVYYWCRLCKAKMIFKKTNSGLIIHKFQNHHVHLTSRRDILSTARKLVEKKLNEVGIQEIKTLLMKQFKFNLETTQGVIDQVISASPLEGIQKILMHKGYELRYQGEDKAMPDVLLAISGSMKETCKIWGDQVTFNVIYDLLRHKKGSKRYLAGTFTGLASDLQLVIFGACVMVVETKQSFCSLFKSFFEVTGKMPDALITDDKPQIVEAIQQLQHQNIFKGYHVLDTFQVLKTLQKQTNEQRYANYKKLLLTRYEYKYQSHLRKLAELEGGGAMGDSSVKEVFQENLSDQEPNLKEEEENVSKSIIEVGRNGNRTSRIKSSIVQEVQPPALLSYITSRSEKLCFSQLPHQFVGFSSLLCRYQNFSKILRQKVKHAYTARKFFMRIDTLQAKMLSKSIRVFISCEYYEKKFNDEKLRDVRLKVGKRLLDRFICLYVEGLVDVVRRDGDAWVVTDPNHMTFRVFVDNNQCFCGCGYSEKMGLPCEHMIAVIKQSAHLTYISHFHTRWISEGYFRKQPRIGPPRRSGRRLMRH